MDNLIISANVVLPLFLCMALGYGIRAVGLVDEHSLTKLNNLTFRVFLPLMLFNNLYRTDIREVFNGKLMLFAVAGVLAVFFVLLLLIPRVEKDNAKRGVLVQGIMRSNFVIFGLPITASLCGEGNTGVTALMVAVVVPLFNVLSVVALEVFRNSRPDVKKILVGVVTNPLILASLAGLLALAVGLRLPAFAQKAVDDVAGIATPLALIVLGGSFRFSRVRGYVRQLLIGVGGRLLVLPAVFVPLGALLGFRGPELVCVLTAFGTPTAVSSFTMAQQMGGDSELAAQLVVFGSLLSVFTMFGWVLVFKSLGWF